MKSKTILLKSLSGVLMVAIGVSAVLFTAKSVTKADITDPDVTSTWHATKLLTLDFTAYKTVGPRNIIGIGPAEWQVTYNVKNAQGVLTPKYQEIWSVPASIPNCLQNNSACGQVSGNATDWMWGVGAERNGSQLNIVPGPLLAPNDPAFFVRNPQSFGSRAAGQSAYAMSDVEMIYSPGAYGWADSAVNKDTPSRSGIFAAGIFMPLTWTVKGKFLP